MALSISDIQIEGSVAPGYEPVRDAFAANFHRAEPDAELGAGLSVHVDGRCVVDLWGGFADVARQRAWTADTLANVWSATKGVVAIAVAMLVDQGRLRYEDRVAQHWPEFGQAGKDAITVAQLMSHQSGLNGFALPMTLDGLYDWEGATSALAAQAPFWPPGSVASYHALTFGFLAGELIRRVSGRDVGRFVHEAIAVPLGADIFIGLPEELDGRISEIVAPVAPGVINGEMPAEIPGWAVVNPRPNPVWPNLRAWRAAQIPAANGQASARGLGRLYGAIANGGTLDGVTIISAEGIDRLRKVRHAGPDQLLGPRHWAAGVSLNVVPAYGPLPGTFGHTGWGGAYGCANRERRIGIGYVMNRMGSQLVGSTRGGDIAAAVFGAQG
jgi:CubicO group peptidase (beta-lactamase class C family)